MPPSECSTTSLPSASLTIPTINRHLEEFCRDENREQPLFDMCVVLRRGLVFPNDGMVIDKQPTGDYCWFEQDHGSIALMLHSWFRRICSFVSTPPNLSGYLAGRPIPSTNSGLLSVGS